MPNPRGRGGGNNLHAYWDDLLGTDRTRRRGEAGRRTDSGIPEGRIRRRLTKTNIRDWAEESVQISLKTVYNNLDPEITNFAGRAGRLRCGCTEGCSEAGGTGGVQAGWGVEEVVRGMIDFQREGMGHDESETGM